MDRLGVRNQSNKKSSTNKKPIKVVYIDNPTMVKASAADFRALVQELTGNINASGGRTITSPPPIGSPDENHKTRPSQNAEITSAGVLINPAEEMMGSDERPLSVDNDSLFLEDLILPQFLLDGSTVFESDGRFTSQLVNYEPFGVRGY